MNHKKFLTITYIFTSFLFVKVVSAQTVQGYANDFQELVSIARGTVLTLVIIFFFWGIGKFILNAGDSKLKEEGKQRMLWGIIAVFVVLSLFGLVAYLGNVFGVAPCTNLQTCYPPPN